MIIFILYEYVTAKKVKHVSVKKIREMTDTINSY